MSEELFYIVAFCITVGAYVHIYVGTTLIGHLWFPDLSVGSSNTMDHFQYFLVPSVSVADVLPLVMCYAGYCKCLSQCTVMCMHVIGQLAVVMRLMHADRKGVNGCRVVPYHCLC